MSTYESGKIRSNSARSVKWIPFAAGFVLLAAAVVYGSLTSPPAKAAGGTSVQAAMTVYLDVGPGGRGKKAAKDMTELHQKQAEQGRSVVDVEPWIENGDLEGFYITYVKQD